MLRPLCILSVATILFFCSCGNRPSEKPGPSTTDSTAAGKPEADSAVATTAAPVDSENIKAVEAYQADSMQKAGEAKVATQKKPLPHPTAKQPKEMPKTGTAKPTTKTGSPKTEEMMGEKENLSKNTIQEEKATVNDKELTEASTTARPPVVTPPYSMGVIAYYCPHTMQQQKPSTITVIISKTLTQEVAAKEVVSNITTDNPKLKVQQVTNDTRSDSIKVSKKMRVELHFDDTSKITVLSPPLIVEHEMDDTEQEWDWSIVPKKAGGLNVEIIVSYWDENAQKWQQAARSKTFSINVNINSETYFSSLWDFITGKPEWLFIQIIFPVVAFFAGRKTKKKDGD